MKRSRAKTKAVVGVIFVIAGLGMALNGLISGSHAFSSGIFAVAAFYAMGLLLVGVGGKLVYDGTRYG